MDANEQPDDKSECTLSTGAATVSLEWGGAGIHCKELPKAKIPAKNTGTRTRCIFIFHFL